MPDPLPRWRIAWYVFVAASFFIGVGFNVAASYRHSLASFGAIFYIVPAAFGATEALRHLRMNSWLTHVVKDNRKMPVSIQIDGDSGYATITRFDGELVSLHLPEEILEAGPEVVMAFVIDALED